MQEKTYYTIGEVSKLCGIAASTLRYYDQIDLIKPSELNVSNNYRYYTYKDIAKIKIIQNLRELNFTINEIVGLLEEDTLGDQLSHMKKKRETIGKELQNLQNTYHSLDKRITSIESEMKILASHSFNENVIELKEIPERKIYSIRKQDVRANLSTYTLYFNELIESAKKENMIPSTHLIMIHHHIDVNTPLTMLENQQARKDLELGFLMEEESSKQSGSILKGGLYLSMTRRGMAGKDTFQEVYTMIQEWLQENHYIAAGPMIDVLLTDLTNMRPDHVVDNILTEVQIRIEKRS